MGRKRGINWPEVIREYETGNETVEKFCAEKGIHPNTFYRNRKNYQDDRTTLVKLPLQPAKPIVQTLLIQAGDFILKIPEGVDRETLETTLRVLKDVK
jgi:transposase-like protein